MVTTTAVQEADPQSFEQLHCYYIILSVYETMYFNTPSEFSERNNPIYMKGHR